jgi:gamma-glutamyltranspeptidase/glutathione hydrolase
VVAASHPAAAEAGAELLRGGGNAFDAAAAVQFALNVAEPLASGLGGGAFSLVRLADGQTLLLDSRERAPAAARAEQFLGADGRLLDWPDQVSSGLAVATPGTLLGLAEMLRRWGTRPLADTLQPAIGLAEQGTTVGPFMARRLAQQVGKLRRDPASAALFLPGGRPLQQGERLRQPDLARCLRLLAAGGPAVFYQGEIGRALVETVRAAGGALSVDDLAAYTVAERRPLRGRFRQYEILTVPPPGAGLTLLQMLALLEPFELADRAPLGVERAHLELQAMRLALLDRAAYLADPDVAAVPLAGLLDPGYLAARRALIQRGPLGPEPRAGQVEGGADRPPAADREHGQTTHFVVIDGWGNLVSTTSTIEDFFGCGLTVPGYGFLLNNEMTDFALAPGGPNEIKPFARPPSSMAPTLVLERGEPLLALGSPGGPTIAPAVLQALLRHLADGLPLAEAIGAPRWFASGFPHLTWERGLPESTLAGLVALGHRPSQRPTTIGSVQAARRDPSTGAWEGAADPRREGAVVYVDP